MSEAPERALRIAVAAEYRKLAAEVERGEKAKFLAENLPGDRKTVVDDQGTVLGAVAVRKPAKPTTRFEISDEAAVLAWAREEFGDEVLEILVQLSEQGIASVMAAAKSAHARGVELPPGVTAVEPEPGEPTVAWTPEKGVDAAGLLAGMWRRGALDPTEILSIGDQS